MKDAIANGTVPGSFNADRTVWSFPTLSYTGARGATHQWTVRVSLLPAPPLPAAPITDEMLDQPVFALPPDSRAEIMVESLRVGGKVRSVVPTYVSVGKNLGKANATNALTQALRDALGKYLKQRKRADLVVVPGAEAVAAEAPAAAAAEAPAAAEEPAPAEKSAPDAPAAYDARPPPMLVKKLGDSREATFTPATFAEGVTAQRKLNGVHLVTYAVPGPPVQILRYSRTATSYPGQEHLAAELLPMFLAAPAVVPGKYGLPADAPPELIAAYAGTPAPVYLDGELYKHGKSLNWISGQARRGDDEGLLEFHVFDVFFPRAKAAGHDMASRDRQQYLRDFFAAGGAAAAHPHVVSVDNFPARDMAELQALAKRFAGEAEGYEGAIARKDGAGYRYSYSNYHSANLVKVKAILDDEFPVVGFTQGTKGKDVGALVWVCEVLQPLDPTDRTFNVVPKNMTYEDRRALFRCLGELVDGPGGVRVTRFERDFRGKPLTVAFPERSAKTGKPLQAKALIFRTYEGGPEADPVRRALEECGAAS